MRPPVFTTLMSALLLPSMIGCSSTSVEDASATLQTSISDFIDTACDCWDTLTPNTGFDSKESCRDALVFEFAAPNQCQQGALKKDSSASVNRLVCLTGAANHGATCINDVGECGNEIEIQKCYENFVSNWGSCPAYPEKVLVALLQCD